MLRHRGKELNILMLPKAYILSKYISKTQRAFLFSAAFTFSLSIKEAQ